MQTQFTPEILATSSGQRANDILRKCVHCGFCTATCPTYQLLGDELDGPRGRVYQIKQLFEGQQADIEVMTHLDRCLSCRSCETTCPSGVDYAELVDLGRQHIEQQNIRPKLQRWIRSLLGAVLPYPSRHRLMFKMAHTFRPLMPASLKSKAPVIRTQKNYPYTKQPGEKTVLLLEGCAQSTLSPNTNAAAQYVLEALGYRVIRQKPSSCCGAVNHHLNQSEDTINWIQHNLRQWQKLHDELTLEAIVSTATGCGIMLKDYASILNHNGLDSAPHEEILTRVKDISELFDAAKLQEKMPHFKAGNNAVSYHAPCTLSHGHKLADQLYSQLASLGYQISKPRDAHLCCGSAGTYSLLQPAISQQLRNNKLNALQACMPDLIITANVGCEHHLNSASDTPVKHWIELIADDLHSSSD